MEVSNINDKLPVELLETLFGLLPPRDLKSAVLVCKHWRKIGGGPLLWTWVKLWVTSGNLTWRKPSNLADMPEIIRLSRLASVEEITLRVISLKVSLAIEQHEGLKVLTIHACNVSGINSDLLARVVTRMEEVQLKYTKLNAKQWSAVSKYVTHGAKLKKLTISGSSRVKVLSMANPQSLAEIVGALEIVKLDHSYVTTEQSKAMFELLAVKSKLKSIDIRSSDLSSVSVQSLAMVVSKAEEATLDRTRLTTEQCTAIFKATAEISKLKVLNITGFRSNGLSKVDANVISTAVNKVEKVDLNFAELNTKQCSAIFGIAAGNSKLKDLNIGYNDLSSVNPYDMAKAVSNMEKIDLTSTRLTHQQCNEIFKCAEADSKLKVLIIGGIDLHSVESDTLAKTVSKIEECDLNVSKLTTLQLNAIFKLLNEDCKLKKLNLSGVTLSSVEVHVISKAIANLEEIDLGGNDLTTQQLEAIFMEIKNRKKLKNLILCGEDLQSVQIDSLVGALSGLKDVDLLEASLTFEQWDAIGNIPEDCMPEILF